MGEQSEQPDEIQSILTDLDAILKDMGSGKPAAKPGPSGPVLPLPGVSSKPLEAPKTIPPKAESVPAVPPLEVPKLSSAPPPPPLPPPAPPAAATERQSLSSALEDLPTAGSVSGNAASNTPPAPVQSDGPPLESAVSASPADLPADTPKDQIRRVAYIHTQSSQAAQAGFSEFLSNAARTISKKPLYLRQVASLEVHLGSDVNVLVDKARAVKAAAILAIVEGWPAAKADELADVCQRNNILFRLVPAADAQKKSTAVDIIVDMMLLPGED